MTLAVGVIGAGVMGAEHARILRHETVGAILAAVCDADPLRAQAAAAGAQVFADPLALIHDPDVQAIIIAAPDAAHAELALACLKAGKPVLCEKPLAVTAQQALQVVAAEVALGRRLVQVGYMRRFDPAYVEMKRCVAAGQIGDPVLLHNTHRNLAAPEWFTGEMAVTNSFVHEVDISRWLLGAEPVSAQVHAVPGGDPLMITLTTDNGAIISTEIHMNARYGYHVHAELVGRSGSVEMAAPTLVQTNRSLSHGHCWPENWVPRFQEAYRLQLNAWIASLAQGRPTGASAWDGFVATSVAEQVVAALQSGESRQLTIPPRPALYL